MKKTSIVVGIAFISFITALCMENMGSHRIEKVETENPEYHLERELPPNIQDLHNVAMGEYSLPDKNAEPLTVYEDIGIKVDNDKECTDSIKQVISDYLHMDSLEFQEKYKEELYKKGILYCDKDAWKYDGSQLDAFQDEYYNVKNITAIRIYKKQDSPIYHNLNIGDKTDQYEEKIKIDYNTDYAVSIYSKLSDGNLPLIEEISFLKIELDKGTAPEALYCFIESNYYEVMENLEHQTWITSPDGEKAACVSNGNLPKHPAQIFIRYQDDKPYTIFRRTWEHEIAGWIDDNHLICYAIDVGTPALIHLERNEIEAISNKKSDYDTYGAKYTIQENYLIAQDFEKRLYQWKILEKDGEIYVLDTYTKEENFCSR